MSTHKSNVGPVLTFYRVRLSRPLLAELGTMPGVAPALRTRKEGRISRSLKATCQLSLKPDTATLALSLSCQDTFAHHHHAPLAHLHGELLRGHVRQEEPVRVPVQPDGQDVNAVKTPQRWP